MKTIFLHILMLLFCSTLFSQSNESLLDSANTAYSKNKFDVAIKFYEQVIMNGYEAPEVYYNLGNANYKSKRLSIAILNYEKAKKFLPNDDDINYNLKMANTKLIDKIEPLPQLFLNNWWNSFVLSLPEKAWSIIYIALIWIGFIGLSFYLIAKSRLFKQFGLISGLGAFILSFFFFVVAHTSNEISSSHNSGIILSSTVNIKGSPSEQGTNLFILHEGTKVNIEQANADWLEVKIPNGNRGWIKAADLAVI